MLLVLFADHGGLAGPLDADRRVIVSEAGFRAAVVKVGYLVADFGMVLKGHKAVGETCGDIEHFSVLLSDDGAGPLQESGRVRADVDGDVKDRATGAADEFGLAIVAFLPVQSSQGAGLCTERHIGLHHVGSEPFLGKGGFAIGAGKKSAFVAKSREVNFEHARNLFFGKFHGKE